MKFNLKQRDSKKHSLFNFHSPKTHFQNEVKYWRPARSRIKKKNRKLALIRTLIEFQSLEPTSNLLDILERRRLAALAELPVLVLTHLMFRSFRWRSERHLGEVELNFVCGDWRRELLEDFAEKVNLRISFGLGFYRIVRMEVSGNLFKGTFAQII